MATAITSAPSLEALRDRGYVHLTEGDPAAPWLMDGWEWSTDGSMIVARRVESQEARFPATLAKAQRYLGDPLAIVQEGPFASLRAFAGDVFVPSNEPCDRCDGTGYDPREDETECEHCHELTRVQCETCGGDGEVPASMPRRYGIVAGLPVSLPNLAYGLEIVQPCESVRVGYLSTDAGNEYRAMVVEGDGWRVVLMAVNATGLKLESWEVTR